MILFSYYPCSEINNRRISLDTRCHDISKIIFKKSPKYNVFITKMCNTHHLRVLEHKDDAMRGYDDDIPIPMMIIVPSHSSSFSSILYNILYVLTSSAIGYPMGIHSRSIVWSVEEVPMISKICTLLCIFGVYHYVLSDDVNVLRIGSSDKHPIYSIHDRVKKGTVSILCTGLIASVMCSMYH